jgi:hypothetical protein
LNFLAPATAKASRCKPSDPPTALSKVACLELESPAHSDAAKTRVLPSLVAYRGIALRSSEPQTYRSGSSLVETRVGGTTVRERRKTHGSAEIFLSELELLSLAPGPIDRDQTIRALPKL